MTDPLDMADLIEARLAATGIQHTRGTTPTQPPTGRPWVHWYPEPGTITATGLAHAHTGRAVRATLVCCGWSPTQALDSAHRIQDALTGWLEPDNPGAGPARLESGPMLHDPAAPGRYSITLTLYTTTTR